MQKIVSDVVAVPAFVLSAGFSEQIALAAEMATDAAFDFSKAADSVAAVLGSLQSAGLLSFESWDVVAAKFKQAAANRSRDNGAANPDGAAQDCWERVAKRNREIHGLTKPKSENPESVAKAEKREAEKAKLLNVAAGRSAAELKSEVRAMYSEASDESIARAKALEKALKVVEATEKDAVSAQMKPLSAAANDAHKAIMEFMKSQNDPMLLGDYVVLLKRTLDIWKDQKAQGVIA
jgi:hypothetical protein